MKLCPSEADCQYLAFDGVFDDKLLIFCDFLVFKNMFIGIAQSMGYADEFAS